MSLYIHIKELENRGVDFSVVDGELKLEAPEGVLDAETLGYLRSIRGQVVAVLERAAAGKARMAKALEAALADPALAWGESEALAEIEARFDQGFVDYCDGLRDFDSLKPIWREKIELHRSMMKSASEAA